MRDKWTAEYERGGIPSSVRTTPSDAVVWAYQELKRYRLPLATALDLGCGKGRNSLYLAEQGMHVTAMDFTPNAIQHLQDEVNSRGLGHQIHPLVADVTEPWPIAHDSMDLIVDAFCFKHITERSARMAYREQLLRALRVRGHYMISFASVGDGYYGHYVVKNDENGDEVLVTDPANGIESVLYSRQHILQFFEPELSLYRELVNTKPATTQDRDVERGTYAMLLQRRPHAY